MINRRDIRQGARAAQIRNSQNKQWVGEVVSADPTGGRCLVNVRGNILDCAVPAGASIQYGAQVSVARVPGDSRLVVSATGSVEETIYIEEAAAVVSGGGNAPVNIAPDNPMGLEATTLSASSIYLEWSSAGGNTLNFELERSPDGLTYAQVASLTAEKTVYTDTGLTAETLYFYRVRATNTTAFSMYSDSAYAVTGA